jgi:putative alpha-1,2-mannosidase
MMGLFPVAGMPVILIGSPVFPCVKLKLYGGDFVVQAKGAHEDNIYVQRAWLNGRALERSYLRLSEFHGGSELVLEMGEKPSSWAKESRPPSFVS